MAENFKDLELSDGSKPLDPNKNDFFLVTITDLLPGKTYPVEFRWNYSDPAKKGDWGAVVNITTPADALPAVTSVVPAWSGTTFTVTFTSDPSAAGNENLSYYKITLIGGGITKVFSLLPRSGSSQVFSLDNPANKANFGVPQNAFSGSVISVDKNGNESVATTFSLTNRVPTLPTPVLNVTAINNGYSVSYTTPTEDEYNNIEIEEVESNSSTDPGAGYATVFSGVANPAVVIVPNTNKRWIRARFFDDGGLTGSYSTAVSVTPTNPVTIDATGPAAPSSGSLTAGIDNSTGATIGFNAFVNISWSAISDSTLRGYRIRFRENGSSNPYSYVDSPGTGTTFRLNGLAIGTTYEVAVASYDEFNNVSSSYTSLGTAAATGTPFIGKNVTTQGYFGASATGDTGEFRFGYGVESGRRGLRFDSNNYWYIDSSAAASFRLGGSANNYLQWNGGTFTIDGNLVARSGEFRGNVQIISGGSLYSGTVSGGSLIGAGYILNSSGLTFNSASVNGITTINATNGLFTTASANIGGWNVNSSQITKTTSSGTLSLDSTTSQMTVTGYASTSAGIAAPTTGASTDIVFWAGGGRNTSAPFYVRADGFVKASSAEISGTITANSLDTASLDISSAGAITTTSGNFGVTSSGILSATGATLTNGSLTITSGTKTTTIGSNAIISLVDTSTDFLSGGGISISASGGSGTYSATALSFTRGGSTGALIMNPNDLRITAGSASSVTITADDGLSRAAYPIQLNGHVGVLNALYIGDSSSDETSTAAGSHMSSGRLTLRRFGNTPLFLHRTESGSGPLRVATFHIGGVAAGGINAFTGQAAIFVNPSDYRMKENIQDYINASEVIKRARLRKFNFKNSPQEEIVGFIAHEYAEVNPKFVIGEKDAIDEDGNPIYQEMMMGAITPYLIGALKESILKIEQLEARLDALEG